MRGYSERELEIGKALSAMLELGQPVIESVSEENDTLMMDRFSITVIRFEDKETGFLNMPEYEVIVEVQTYSHHSGYDADTKLIGMARNLIGAFRIIAVEIATCKFDNSVEAALSTMPEY